MNKKQDEHDRRPVADANSPGMGIKAFCTRVRRSRESYKEGALGETTVASVEVHLQHCDECAKYYED